MGFLNYITMKEIFHPILAQEDKNIAIAGHLIDLTEDDQDVVPPCITRPIKITSKNIDIDLTLDDKDDHQALQRRVEEEVAKESRRSKLIEKRRVVKEALERSRRQKIDEEAARKENTRQTSAFYREIENKANAQRKHLKQLRKNKIISQKRKQVHDSKFNLFLLFDNLYDSHHKDIRLQIQSFL